MTKNVRLEGTFTLLAPLSHIGESISNTSYLVEDSIIQPDGSVEKVFAYSGNAWRGQLRDLMASYMLEKLGRPNISLDTFHLLYSGGKIGGAQTTDMAQARRVRAAIPMISLLGGGIGNQILQGKLRVGTCYPLCVQAVPVLPSDYHAEASKIDYTDATFTKEYSRRDDTKVESVSQYLLTDQSANDKPKKDKEASQQMRIRSELVSAGVKLRTWIVGTDLTEIEFGALVSGLHEFSKQPFIGGQSSRGHGLVNVDYRLIDLDSGETADFVRVNEDKCLLSPRAAESKDKYDAYLKEVYDGMLTSNKSEIINLLAA